MTAQTSTSWFTALAGTALSRGSLVVALAAGPQLVAAQPAPVPAPSAAPSSEPSAAPSSEPSSLVAPSPEPAPLPTGDAETASYSAVATATRSPELRLDVPATVTLLPREYIDHHPSLTTDSLLRSVPSAATFRRSTSLVADPSAQGLNLRGVAPSGVSRTLVLLDGVPANDPFGGWIYWRAIPRLGLERIEIVPGGGSALYGSAALGGVVQLYSRSTLRSSLDADVSYGTQRTFALGARGAHRFGAASASIEGDYLRSDGYVIVAPEQRGPIDRETPSEHGNVDGRFEYRASRKLRLGATLGFFREVQNGGTEFTTADVTQGRASLEGHLDADDTGLFDLVLFGRRGSFGQVRARIGEGRMTEMRASQQEVPAGDEGGSFTWTSQELGWLGNHTLLAGLDARHVHGESTDRIDPAQPRPDSVIQKTAGGQQWLLGLFAQDLYRPNPRLDLQLSLRADVFRSYDGERSTLRATSSQTTLDSPARGESTLSPRFGALVRALDWLHVRGSIYRAFRAPTLNELYRGFQVGTILTAANDSLEAEILWGGELGVELLARDALSVRLTGFLNFLDDPIANVTLDAPLPDGSMRQRQNLGSARVHGLELDARYRFTRELLIQFGYVWASSEVTDASAMPDLVGKHLAQDPEHRITATFLYDRPEWFAALVQLRMVGTQYEDDQNMLLMDGYIVLDASVSRRIVSDLEVFLAAENVFDADYLVGRAGVDTLGAPASLRVGLRMRSTP